MLKIYDYKGKKNICGDRIHEARTRQRMTQQELAARMQIEGVTLERDSISRVEIGTRFVTDYEVVIFAKVLGVSVIWLLGEEYLSAFHKARRAILLLYYDAAFTAKDIFHTAKFTETRESMITTI